MKSVLILKITLKLSFQEFFTLVPVKLELLLKMRYMSDALLLWLKKYQNNENLNFFEAQIRCVRSMLNFKEFKSSSYFGLLNSPIFIIFDIF